MEPVIISVPQKQQAEALIENEWMWTRRQSMDRLKILLHPQLSGLCPQEATLNNSPKQWQNQGMIYLWQGRAGGQ